MSESHWRQRAAAVVCATLKALPKDADAKAKRKALRDAYPFGARKHWPYKMWCSVVREALDTTTPGKIQSRRPHYSRRKPVTDFMPSLRQWALDKGLAYEPEPEEAPELPLS